MEVTGSNRRADAERERVGEEGVDGVTYSEVIADSKAHGALHFPFGSRGKRKEEEKQNILGHRFSVVFFVLMTPVIQHRHLFSSLICKGFILVEPQPFLWPVTL